MQQRKPSSAGSAVTHAAAAAAPPRGLSVTHPAAGRPDAACSAAISVEGASRLPASLEDTVSR